MKLLKRNILNGQTVEVSASDAFDEICANNFGSLEDWDIKCFSEFENAFKEDKEMEITCGDWTFENIPEKIKKTDEEFLLERQGKAMEEYLDRAIGTARRVVLELEGYKSKVVDQNYIKNSGKEKIVQWAMNMLQQINWHFDEGADVATKYAVAKLAKEFAEKQG